MDRCELRYSHNDDSETMKLGLHFVTKHYVSSDLSIKKRKKTKKKRKEEGKRKKKKITIAELKLEKQLGLYTASQCICSFACIRSFSVI